MSSIIGPDPHLGLTGLDRLSGRVALDDARHSSDQPALLRETAPQAEIAAPSAAPEVGIGEQVMAAAAWPQAPAGERQLPGDLAFEHALAGQDLSVAADNAIDAILSALTS